VTRGDVLVVIAVVALALVSVLSAGAVFASADAAAVLRGPAGSTTVDLSVSGMHIVEGRSGEVVFRVADGEVRAISADCPDSLCVGMGAAAPGRPVVCAPNGVSASINGVQGEALDAVSR
jgi:hypothetical protein